MCLFKTNEVIPKESIKTILRRYDMRKFKRGAWKYYNKILKKQGKQVLSWQEYRQLAKI